MEIEKIKQRQDVACNITDVVMIVTPEELEEFRLACVVIEKYEKAALAAYREKYGDDPIQSDWCQIRHIIRANKITVNIKDGMAG